MDAKKLQPTITTYPWGDGAPEACQMAEHLQQFDVEAHSPPTGDHALYVADGDLTPAVRRVLHESHYTEGLPRTAYPNDGYTGFKPASGRHPDGH